MKEKKKQDIFTRTEREMTADEYWNRLSRSFNADYIRSVKEKYDSRKRLQMA